MIEVILSLAQERRHVSIVAAAFASRSDSSLRKKERESKNVEKVRESVVKRDKYIYV